MGQEFESPILHHDDEARARPSAGSVFGEGNEG
jgi:hypothetical protein